MNQGVGEKIILTFQFQPCHCNFQGSKIGFVFSFSPNFDISNKLLNSIWSSPTCQPLPQTETQKVMKNLNWITFFIHQRVWSGSLRKFRLLLVESNPFHLTCSTSMDPPANLKSITRFQNVFVSGHKNMCRYVKSLRNEKSRQGWVILISRENRWDRNFLLICLFRSWTLAQPLAHRHMKQLVALPANRNKVTGVEAFHFQYILLNCDLSLEYR